jgi:SAM-dependent methyltransferase
MPGGVSFADVFRRRGATYDTDPARLVLHQARFEELTLDEPLDFICSNDVMEHVADPAAVFRSALRVLRPGGLFVNNIDLCGHNVFAKTDRPLDFLTCGDHLWDLMFSHVMTTNRVRFSEFVRAAEDAGFKTAHVEVVLQADPAYLASVKPHLLPRYRDLPDDDLSVLQFVLVNQR